MSFYKWLISKTKHSQALLWCQHYLSFNMITDMVKTTNHSVSVEAYYTQYPRACVHLPCNVFIVGVSGGALVNIVPTKACVPHNECRITLQQPRSSIWKPRWRYRSSVSYSVLLVYGPKYWEIRRDTQIWDSYLIKTIAWKATIVSIYSVCVCVGWGMGSCNCTPLSAQVCPANITASKKFSPVFFCRNVHLLYTQRTATMNHP